MKTKNETEFLFQDDASGSWAVTAYHKSLLQKHPIFAAAPVYIRMPGGEILKKARLDFWLSKVFVESL